MLLLYVFEENILLNMFIRSVVLWIMDGLGIGTMNIKYHMQCEEQNGLDTMMLRASQSRFVWHQYSEMFPNLTAI